jgi:transposase
MTIRRSFAPTTALAALPVYLPRDEVVIDVDSKESPCCGGVLYLIGERCSAGFPRLRSALCHAVLFHHRRHLALNRPRRAT